MRFSSAAAVWIACGLGAAAAAEAEEQVYFSYNVDIDCNDFAKQGPNWIVLKNAHLTDDDMAQSTDLKKGHLIRPGKHSPNGMY